MLISQTQQDKQLYFLVIHGKLILIYLNFFFYRGLRSSESKADIVNLLLQFGADKNHQDNNEETPLIFGIFEFSSNIFHKRF
jgi:hypothetical protein